MIELTKHIEILLLENDCVIVPELGGFITHYQPAHYEESEGVYLPPTRTVGFNPQLTMNDGLLAQAYMQTHHTDFLDASKTISVKVKELKDALYNDGFVEMPGVGVLHYTMYNQYEFHPLENGVLAPELYALDTFSISPLTAEVVSETVVQPEVIQEHQIVPEKKKTYTLNTQWWSNAVAVVIAAVLFFALSVPVENTYIDKGNYASLGTNCLFDAIRSQSLATTLATPAQEVPQKNKPTNITPVVVKVEKVASAPVKMDAPKEVVTPKVDVSVKAETPKVKETPKAEVKKAETPKVEAKKPVAKPSPVAPKKKYHLIVASLITSADAERMLKEYKQQGHNGASVVQGSGRFRISLCSYAERSQAQNKLNELKKSDAFKNAWMLTSK